MQEVFEKIIEQLEIFVKDTDAISKTNEIYNGAGGFYKAIEIVKQAAAEYNGGWIPYSERLPEGKQRCLTTAKIYFVPDHVDEEDNYIGVAIDTYFEKFVWSSNPEVIAWQPLPEPYTKGE